MGLGPTLSMPRVMLDRLPALLAESRIRCQEAALHKLHGRRFRFRRLLASADASVRESGPEEVRLHIVCTHGMNPLMWWPEVRLVNRLQRIMLEHGASPCTYEAFFESDDVG
jgi:hypothetical protein